MKTVSESVGYVFESAERALLWSAELLRRRRLPQNAGFWREIAAEAEFVARAYAGPEQERLPEDPMDRLDVALKVEAALVRVAARDGRAAEVLRLWAYGDFADDVRLHKARTMQEKLRREGMRVRLSYRYSYGQLGLLYGCDKKVAWRWVQDGLGLLGEELGVRNEERGGEERGMVEEAGRAVVREEWR